MDNYLMKSCSVSMLMGSLLMLALAIMGFPPGFSLVLSIISIVALFLTCMYLFTRRENVVIKRDRDPKAKMREEVDFKPQEYDH